MKKNIALFVAILMLMMHAEAVESLDTTNLAKIGDMTAGGGLQHAVEPLPANYTGYRPSVNGWAGVTLSTPTRIEKAEVTSATNGFDASGSTSQIALKLYGKQGAAPTGPTNGTLLGTVGPFTDVNATTVKTILSNDISTEWDHAWVHATTGVWTVFDSVKFHEPEDGPPPGQSQKSYRNGKLVEFVTESLLVTTLPLTTGPYPNLTPKQVLKLNIGPVQAGDIIWVSGEAEFTNDNNYAVSVVSQITLAKSPTFGTVIQDILVQKFDRSATSDAYEICKSNGPNLDKSIIHHSPHLRSGVIVVSAEMAAALGSGDVYVIFWGWAGSTAAGSGHIVSVGDDETGQLVVTRWRE